MRNSEKKMAFRDDLQYVYGFGVRIPIENDWLNSIECPEKSCSHIDKQTTGAFCSECGVKVKIVNRVTQILSFNKIRLDDQEMHKQTKYYLVKDVEESKTRFIVLFFCPCFRSDILKPGLNMVYDFEEMHAWLDCVHASVGTNDLEWRQGLFLFEQHHYHRGEQYVEKITKDIQI